MNRAPFRLLAMRPADPEVVANVEGLDLHPALVLRIDLTGIPCAG